MVPPASGSRSSEMQIAPPPDGLAVTLPGGARTTRHFLRTAGFHLLFVLLGIALAFM